MTNAADAADAANAASANDHVAIVVEAAYAVAVAVPIAAADATNYTTPPRLNTPTLMLILDNSDTDKEMTEGTIMSGTKFNSFQSPCDAIMARS